MDQELRRKGESRLAGKRLKPLGQPRTEKGWGTSGLRGQLGPSRGGLPGGVLDAADATRDSSRVHLFPAPRSVTSHWQCDVSHGGNGLHQRNRQRLQAGLLTPFPQEPAAKH